MPKTENINWKFTKEAIQQHKTVLFLGHGATVNFKDPLHEASFFREFSTSQQSERLSFHENDGFLVFPNESTKMLHLSNIKPFYEQDFRNDTLDKLAEIPFHLIINLSPDMTLPRIFEDQNFAFQHNYYKPKIKREIAEAPNSDRPLIYNLLGCIEDDESLITSHYDLFDLVQSIYADANLPDLFSAVFSKAATKNIIFLGLDFSKWYFQLILHLLKINYEPCIRYAEAQAEDQMPLQTLYESFFKINFVNEDIASFVDELHAQFQPDELRQAKPKDQQKPKVYKKSNILKFLAATFNANDFETFCMLYFDEVYDNFVPTQNQTSRLTALMDYVNRQDAFEKLLELGREENPIQYQKFEPYYEAWD